MPRIAHVISTRGGIGGAERVVVALVERGKEAGWDQKILNPFATDPSDSWLQAKSSGIRYAGRRYSTLADLPRMRRWLRQELEEFAPCVVHAHLFHAIVSVATLRQGTSSWIATHHHGDFLRAQGRVMQEFADRRSGLRYDLIVAVSRSVRDFLIMARGYPEDKVLVIPNGWQGEPVPPARDAHRPTVVSTANFRVEKGHEVLLAAFRRVVSQLPSARLLLVGDGPLEQALRRQTQELSLEEHVRLVGSVENVWPYLAKAHVFALPSLSETGGIGAMEAMAAGLPVVASGVGGIPEVVVPGVTGVLVPPGDDLTLGNALIDLLRSPDDQRKMGVAGRKRAEGFRMCNTADAYFDVYGSMMSKTRA